MTMTFRRFTTDIGQLASLGILYVLLGACSDYTAPPPPTPVDVVVPFCAGSEPAWVAFQDGAGAWTRVLPVESTGGVTFGFTFTSGRGAIATATLLNAGAFTSLRVVYGTPSQLENTGVSDPLSCGTPQSRNWHGDVAGLAGDETALISAGHFSNVGASVARTDFVLSGIPDGAQDLLASLTGPTFGLSPVSKLILRRDLDLPDGSALPPLDFSSNEAFSPTVRNATIADAGPDGAGVSVELLTSHGGMALPFLVSDATASTRQYFAIPADRLRDGDVQLLAFTTIGPGQMSRAESFFFRSAVDRTVRFGPTPAAPAISVVSSTPALRLRARIAPQPEYDRWAGIRFSQLTSTVDVNLLMTSEYAALSGGDFDLVMPDLTSVTGFDPSWTLNAGSQVVWFATRVGGNVQLGAERTDGSHVSTVETRGTFTLP